MSWITELADKAENILNKIDQNAASALHVSATDSDVYANANAMSSFSSSILKSPPRAKLRNNRNLELGCSNEISSKNDICSSSKSVIIDIGSNDSLKNVYDHNKVEIMEKIKQRAEETRDVLQKNFEVTNEDNKKYSQTVLELESHLAKLKQDNQEISRRLAAQVKENGQQVLEFQEYKRKAQGALQAKDILIDKLKRSLTAVDTNSSFKEKIGNSPSELCTLKQELHETLMANNCLITEKERLKKELIAMQEKYQLQLGDAQKICEVLREDLRVENEKNVLLQSDFKAGNEKVKILRQEMSHQMSALTARLEEKDRIIEQLQAQTFSQDFKTLFCTDVESRLVALTRSLIDKQNAIENITLDRNALKLQLEITQDELRKVVSKNIRSTLIQNSVNPNANTTDDVKAQFPLLMKETPFDNRVARRVKRAYSTLDSTGIRLGVFLRRYPLVRIFVLIYIGLVHIWVMFVLLSSTPT